MPLKIDHLWSITLGSPRASDWDDDDDLDLVITVADAVFTDDQGVE